MNTAFNAAFVRAGCSEAVRRNFVLRRIVEHLDPKHLPHIGADVFLDFLEDNMNEDDLELLEEAMASMADADDTSRALKELFATPPLSDDLLDDYGNVALDRRVTLAPAHPHPQQHEQQQQQRQQPQSTSAASSCAKTSTTIPIDELAGRLTQLAHDREWCRRVKWIDLSGNRLGDEGPAAYKAALLPTLRRIRDVQQPPATGAALTIGGPGVVVTLAHNDLRGAEARDLVLGIAAEPVVKAVDVRFTALVPDNTFMDEVQQSGLSGKVICKDTDAAFNSVLAEREHPVRVALKALKAAAQHIVPTSSSDLTLGHAASAQK
ncbi:hypothetical protein PTSG_03567 [Salpingoeca rosetta]|uniref:Uncharacterized protein n=1 Tax=Salpingoeca rosetta (strain ATCC 50818 / BSB-021) TaxID=946362 RepID=F2U5Z3_SALR5|nr:uncharacterized protein PTSG_03567 [Salpingoeca rosetta]EGD82934.1 hypothetical protein PTSG_03567 [Salpingoeca rosetta]|eukprot:XP_004995298.1 hypothetical protein PTSG_03567 [Salpingoeca rosetta]